MRELSPAAEAKRILSGKSVAWVIEIDLPAPYGTLYFANRSNVVLGGNPYSAKLIRIEDLGKISQVGVNLKGQVGSSDGLEFEIMSLPEESADRFRDIIALTEIDGSIVRFGLVFLPSTAWADIIWYHTYLIDSYRTTTRSVVIRCVDFAMNQGSKKFGREVTDAIWNLAPSGSYGKFIPQIFGTHVDCPLIPVDIGGQTILDGSVEETDKEIVVSSMKDFANAVPGGYAIQIEDEQILVKSVNRGTRTFGDADNSCVRGYAGTAAAAHGDGAGVFEIQSRYDYLVADHPCLSVGNVRIGQKLIASAGYHLDNPTLGGIVVQRLRFYNRPMGETMAPGSTRLRIDGEQNPYWSVNADNTAENGAYAFDPTSVFSFARLKKDLDLLSIRMGQSFADGVTKYGRLKKLWAGIEYFCSKRWGDGTYPYIWIWRNDAAVGGMTYLQRPSVEDAEVVVDEHDHQVQSDWTVNNASVLSESPEQKELGILPTTNPTWNPYGPGIIFIDSEWKFANINAQSDANTITKIILHTDLWINAGSDLQDMQIHIRLDRPGTTYKTLRWGTLTTGDGHNQLDLEIKVSDVGAFTIDEIKNGTVKFLITGHYLFGAYFTFTITLDIYYKLKVVSQTVDVDQSKDSGKTSYAALLAQGATSRVTQMIDLTSVAAANGGGWGLLNGVIDFRLNFNGPADDAEVYVVNVFFEAEYQPIAREFAQGDVLADVEGMMSGGVLITHPMDILHILVCDIMGVGSGYIDPDSFASVKAALDVVCPVVGRWIGDSQTLAELINSLLTDIGVRMVFEGLKYYFSLRPDYLEPESVIAEIDKDYFLEKSIDRQRSSTDQIFNQLAIYYNKNLASENFKRVLEVNDFVSQGKNWGVRRETYDALWHGDRAVSVQWIAKRLLTWGAWKYAVAQITAPLEMVHVARGDVVELTEPRSGLDHQLCEVATTKITGLDRIQFGLAFWDAVRIFSGTGAHVDVDRGGRVMRFFVDDRLVATLDASGNLRVKGAIRAGMGDFMAGGEAPTGDDLFVVTAMETPPGHYLSVPLQVAPEPAAWWQPIIFWGDCAGHPQYGVNIYGKHIRSGVPITDIIDNYVKWVYQDYVALAPNGHDVVMKFERVAYPEADFPGIWTIKGIIGQL